MITWDNFLQITAVLIVQPLTGSHVKEVGFVIHQTFCEVKHDNFSLKLTFFIHPKIDEPC